jgi:hypothetical protein
VVSRLFFGGSLGRDGAFGAERDIPDLVDKKGIRGKLEGLAAIRLKAESLPNPMDRRWRISQVEMPALIL